MTLHTIILCSLLLLTLLVDIRIHRIPNILIFFGLFFGICCQICSMDMTRVLCGIAGSMLAVILLYPLFLIRVLGAGDIKLLSVLGMFFGWRGSIYCIGYSFLIGALFSIIYMLYHQTLFQRFFHLYNYIRETLTTGHIGAYRKGGYEKGVTIHFSIPIFISALLYAGGSSL